ncbi:MAG: AAA family ATPase [Planctomycetales bacterium]|nr:AAA family ATPase [Planctomycetales bacterium]
MKIKDIQIDGFGVWAGLTVHSMPDSMTVFYGPNEAGKTTLMQFLRTMFYGFTPDRKLRYLPPVNGGKPGGAIRVTGPGGGYEITRRAQLDQGASTGQLTVTGSDGLAQGQHRLAMLLGQVDESIFTNVFAIGLRELQELSTLDDTAAADELYKLSSGLDRVSLVDVTRQLRIARQQIVGPTPDQGQMQHLMLQREKLKDEIEHLIGHGRRWNELASLRNTQNAELDELKQRIAQWEVESRTFEVALQVRPNWQKRAELQAAILALGARTDLPENVGGKLSEISTQIAEREERIGEIKDKRRALREQARRLPLRSGILELAAKIEAAAEQAPWINSIQKNIQRLEGQIGQTREQLCEDATRLGIGEEDQQALLDDRRMVKMPDLSRQAINQLAEPASEVRLWSNRLKQAKAQGETDKKEADRLEKELSNAMSTREQKDISAAIAQSGDMLGLLRKRLAVQEALDRQLARRKTLDEEAVDLTVEEALPVERSLLMAVFFIGGMFLFCWGLANMSTLFGTNSESEKTTGLLMIVFGLCLLFFGFMWSSVLNRGTVSELEEVEDQIDALRKEIRKTQDESDELQRRLPPHNGTIEARIRETEAELESLESLLPTQHNYQAALGRYKAMRKRASQASEALEAAKRQWQRTLAQLGLSETLSPKSIRIMAEGYDSLLQTRRRLQSLEEELETRQLELGALTQRIDSLAKQVFAAKLASDVAAGEGSAEDLEDEFDERSSDFEKRRAVRMPAGTDDLKTVRADSEMANVALSQLTKLTSLISSQEQFIHQKRSLKEQDQQLAKQFASIQKSIDKLHRSHSAILAENGCESEEHFIELLEIKAKHSALEKQLAEYGDRIQAVISGSVPYELIERLLDGPGAHEIEKRWEQIGLRTQQAEGRVAQLHERQGELSQEMKSLAANSRLAEAKLELACIENQLKACGDHWQTLAVTTGLLERVCEVYENERQPETLREASAFLSQLTEGKYVRIWTPLGKNQLRIDNSKGQALPLEVLSRGTREAVFIALRLSLAAAYARRGVTIPIVLDDVLVNFDSIRAESAAKVLRDFSSLGHQVIMFTCHEHIMRIFYGIDVQVRVLPPQGHPGEAEICNLEPQFERHALPALETVETTFDMPVEFPEPELQLPDEPEPEPEPELAEPQQQDVLALLEDYVENEAETMMEEALEKPVVQLDLPTLPPKKVVQISQPKAKPSSSVKRVVVVEQEPEIDWLWYERNPESIEWGWVESEDRVDEKTPPPDLWFNRAKSTL